MTTRLNESEPLETALRRLAVESIDTALAALDEREGRDVAIHSVRKECKRSRALLRLFSDAIGDGWQRECHEFRDLSRSISVVRDARVILDVHAAMITQYGNSLDALAIATMRQQLIADIQSGVDAHDATPTNDMLRQRLQSAKLRARRWTIADASERALEQGFVRTYRRGRAAARRARAVPHESNFHELRKRAKDLWYQLELLARRWPDTALRRVAPTRRLTELLGDAHDLVIYREAVERAAVARARETGEILAALADRRCRALEAEAALLTREVFADKPKRFRAALERRDFGHQAAG